MAHEPYTKQFMPAELGYAVDCRSSSQLWRGSRRSAMFTSSAQHLSLVFYASYTSYRYVSYQGSDGSMHRSLRGQIQASEAREGGTAHIMVYLSVL